jgi:hypothetical protein
MILTGSDRDRERRLILDGAWPHFPILPVQRNADEDDLGLLIWRYVPTGREATSGPWRVYLVNLVEVSLRHRGEKVTWAKALEGVRYIEYPTLDDFFDAGWRGD